MKSLPNMLTIARIVMIPIIIGLLYVSSAWAVWSALALYVLAAVTDFFDGYFARKLDVVSDFGRFLDPIADKILVGCLLITLAAIGRLEGLWIVPALLIIVREFLVSGLREYLGPRNVKMPVTQLAKWKTVVQMVALGILIVGDVAGALLIGQICLMVAAIMTVITGWNYMQVGMRHMKD